MTIKGATNRKSISRRTYDAVGFNTGTGFKRLSTSLPDHIFFQIKNEATLRRKPLAEIVRQTLERGLAIQRVHTQRMEERKRKFRKDKILADTTSEAGVE